MSHDKTQVADAASREKAIAAHNGPLSSYRAHVARRMEERDDPTGDKHPILNKTPQHAAIIVEHVFKAAGNHVNILSGFFNPDVYGTPLVIEEIVAFLRRGGSLRLLCDKCHNGGEGITLSRLSQNHAVIDRLREEGLLDRVEARMVPEKVAKLYPYHFAVADGRSYRFEADKEQCTAFGQFGDDAIGGSLDDRFGEIWDLSTPVPLV